MSDFLTITDLELWTHIGIPADERMAEQRLLVTIEMTLDVRATAKSDDVKKSINYCDVTQDMKTLAQTERKTIERFAEDAAHMILRTYKPQSVTVTVTKFTIPNAKEISIKIRR